MWVRLGGSREGDLGFGFGSNFLLRMRPASSRLRNAHVDRNVPVTASQSVGILLCGRARFSVDEHDVTSDPQRWMCAGPSRRLHRWPRLGHERGAGQYAGVVQLEDGAVDAGGQAEVVGVHDEAAHRPSVPIGTDRIGRGETFRADRTRTLV